MNKTNLDFISYLSKLDKKTLSQKNLKLSEENGELSKKILPYDNAHGTLHRFIEKQDILEEVSDCILVAMSIAYSLDFSHEEIEEMMMKKASKWAELQAREARMENILPFEIHVTIKEGDKEGFINTCSLLGVKPIIIAMKEGDSLLKDVMTSSVFMGSNRGAIEELQRVSKGLSDKGFQVIREKIETVPWHTAAPSREFNNSVMPKHCYFESHIGIKISNDKENSSREALEDFCIANDLHLSRNAFKMSDPDNYTIMATYRKYDGYSEDFLESVERISNELTSFGFDVDKVITEFSIYDTKISHDNEWLNL